VTFANRLRSLTAANWLRWFHLPSNYHSSPRIAKLSPNHGLDVIRGLFDIYQDPYLEPGLQQAVFRLLDHPDSYVRAWAAITLSRTGLPQKVQAMPRLAPLLAGTEFEVIAAAAVIGRLRLSEALPFLLPLYHNRKARVRKAVLKALLRIGTTDAIGHARLIPFP
jgi:hypothetical protein